MGDGVEGGRKIKEAKTRQPTPTQAGVTATATQYIHTIFVRLINPCPTGENWGLLLGICRLLRAFLVHLFIRLCAR